jgi:hypothetical protein
MKNSKRTYKASWIEEFRFEEIVGFFLVIAFMLFISDGLLPKAFGLTALVITTYLIIKYFKKHYLR